MCSYQVISSNTDPTKNYNISINIQYANGTMGFQTMIGPTIDTAVNDTNIVNM